MRFRPVEYSFPSDCIQANARVGWKGLSVDEYTESDQSSSQAHKLKMAGSNGKIADMCHYSGKRSHQI